MQNKRQMIHWFTTCAAPLLGSAAQPPAHVSARMRQWLRPLGWSASPFGGGAGAASSLGGAAAAPTITSASHRMVAPHSARDRGCAAAREATTAVRGQCPSTAAEARIGSNTYPHVYTRPVAAPPPRATIHSLRGPIVDGFATRQLRLCSGAPAGRAYEECLRQAVRGPAAVLRRAALTPVPTRHVMPP